LAETVQIERTRHSLDLKEICRHVLGECRVNPHCLEAMITCPVPASWMNERAIKVYQELWKWLRLTQRQRLNLFPWLVTSSKGEIKGKKAHNPTRRKRKLRSKEEDESRFKLARRTLREATNKPESSADQLNTLHLAQATMGFLQSHKISLRDFGEKIGEQKRSFVSAWLHRPQPWAKCKRPQKSFYLKVRAFLAQPENQRFGMVSKKAGADIVVHDEGRTHNLSSREEPSSEVRQGGPLNKAVSRRSLLLKKPLLNNAGTESTKPKTTTKTNSLVDETPVKAGRRRASKSKYPSEDWVVTTADEDSCGEVDEQSADQNVNDENYEADKECQGTPKGLEKRLFSPRKKMESMEIDRLEEIVKARRRCSRDVPEEINTTEIAKQFQAGMENRRVTVIGFANVLGPNRNYLTNLVKRPVPWNDCNVTQRFVYACIKDFFSQ